MIAKPCVAMGVRMATTHLVDVHQRLMRYQSYKEKAQDFRPGLLVRHNEYDGKIRCFILRLTKFIVGLIGRIIKNSVLLTDTFLPVNNL